MGLTKKTEKLRYEYYPRFLMVVSRKQSKRKIL